MSMLIDEFFENYNSNNVEIEGKWYIAKPLYFYKFKNNLIDAWKVLIGKSFAVYFKEDK